MIIIEKSVTQKNESSIINLLAAVSSSEFLDFLLELRIFLTKCAESLDVIFQQFLEAYEPILRLIAQGVAQFDKKQEMRFFAMSAFYFKPHAC